MSKAKSRVSPETVKEAHQIAKATQRPGQTKEQTKLIENGIQKGIAEYKKRQKAKARELDKKLKQAKRQSSNEEKVSPELDSHPTNSQSSLLKMLPWILLIGSWVGFGIYFFNIK